FLIISRPLISTLFPYTTLFRSRADVFCHCGLPSLFLSSLVQNQPCLPIHHGCFGHDLHAEGSPLVGGEPPPPPPVFRYPGGSALDRKSTRLNSSHLVISYAVFC